MPSPTFRPSCFAVATLIFATFSLPSFADSHVRIVRLSYIEGGVEVSRGDSQGFQKAIVNLPIAEGAKLKTSDDGRAEVEFENGSTLRMVPDSAIEFRQLSLRDSGTRVSAVEITRGTAYLEFAGNKSDEFSIGFGEEKIDLAQAAHLRVDLGEKDSVAVFKGLIQVESPNGSVDVKKNQTASFEISDSQYKLSKSIHEEPWDSWDDQQSEYHAHYAAKSYNNYSPYAYGTTDLAYYGNFFNSPGYGMLWQPYFAGAGWDPFLDGAWNFYPGYGYGWVSAYPWGWTPYHSGSWVFLSGRGWAWQPGGVWSAWNTRPVVVNAPKGFAAPVAPASGDRTVFVSRGTVSTFSGSKLVIRNNSAGLGVPRGQFENMAKLSQKVQDRGIVRQRVFTPIAPIGSPSGRAGSASRASAPGFSAPIHTSSAPSRHSSGGNVGHR
jgi:FecR protein